MIKNIKMVGEEIIKCLIFLFFVLLRLFFFCVFCKGYNSKFYIGVFKLVWIVKMLSWIKYNSIIFFMICFLELGLYNVYFFKLFL